MIGANGTKQPPNGAETACEMPSYCRFDTSMAQCAITLVLEVRNSELP